MRERYKIIVNKDKTLDDLVDDEIVEIDKKNVKDVYKVISILLDA